MKLLLQIHDELVFKTPEGEAERMAGVVCEEMERAMALSVAFTPFKRSKSILSDELKSLSIKRRDGSQPHY